MMNNAIANQLVVEISSYKVRMIYGYVYNEKVSILHATEGEINGLKNGFIEDFDNVSSVIKTLKAEIEEKFDIKLTNCILVLPPLKIICKRNNESTKTVDDNNKVCWVDVKNVLSKVSKVSLGGDYKIINVVPYAYSVSGGELIRNPIGEIGSELVIHASVYSLSESLINNYKNAFVKTGLKVLDVVSSPLSSAFNLMDIECVPNNYFLLNIGEEISSFSLIHSNFEVIGSISSQFGGRTITKDLQNRLEIDFEDAENYKKVFGISNDPNFEFLLQDRISVSTIGEIIKDSILKLVDTIKKSSPNWMTEDVKKLPVVITGGTSKLIGIKEYIKEVLGFETIVPSLKTLGARNPGYVSLVGALKYKKFSDEFNNKEENKSSLNDEGLDLHREV